MCPRRGRRRDWQLVYQCLATGRAAGHRGQAADSEAALGRGLQDRHRGVLGRRSRGRVGRGGCHGYYCSRQSNQGDCLLYCFSQSSMRLRNGPTSSRWKISLEGRAGHEVCMRTKAWHCSTGLRLFEQSVAIGVVLFQTHARAPQSCLCGRHRYRFAATDVCMSRSCRKRPSSSSPAAMPGLQLRSRWGVPDMWLRGLPACPLPSHTIQDCIHEPHACLCL